MRRATPWLLACLLLGAAVALWAARPGPAEIPSVSVQTAAEKHYVTPRQLTAAAALAAETVPPLRATDHNGLPFAWPDLQGDRPLVLVFVKEGCPCNVEFEPYFHRLHLAYADVARFAGVIDADEKAAYRYAGANRTPYPVLADPERKLIRRFRAENGAYVALLTPPGTTAALWPGCSAEMFHDLGRRLAAAAGVAVRSFDDSGLPGAMVTGCPFDP